MWGENEIKDPIIEELISSPILQRLKNIDQSGPVVYFGYMPYFSRYEHSIGVFDLLHRVGASTEEKVAGLLHDASHTAFSHVGDHLFYNNNAEKSYQDTIHLWFLEKQKINLITDKYNIAFKNLDPDLPEYKALETHLPDLCADRIQYIIHTGVILNRITKEEAKNIINDLKFNDQKWFFTKIKYAKSLADLSLIFTQEIWGAPWNFVIYEYFSRILQRSLELHLISKDEIHFGTDTNILHKIQKSSDILIQEWFAKLHDIHNCFEVVKFGEGTMNVHPKFRGVDPFILSQKGFKRLSELDHAFKKKFDTLKEWCNAGYGIIPNKNIPQ
jgi:HD superfamily phosphohydrolase